MKTSDKVLELFEKLTRLNTEADEIKTEIRRLCDPVDAEFIPLKVKTKAKKPRAAKVEEPKAKRKYTRRAKAEGEIIVEHKPAANKSDYDSDSNEARILEELNVVGGRASGAHLMTKLGMPTSSFYQAVKNLRDANVLQRAGDGVYEYTSAKGKAA